MFEITSHVIKSFAVPTLSVAHETFFRAFTHELLPGVSGLTVYRSIRITDDRPLYKEVKAFIDTYCGELLLPPHRQKDENMQGGEAETLHYLLEREA